MSAFKFIWLGCKKATFLMSKKEEGKLTAIEKIQLKLHLGICSFCTRFQKQTNFFTKHAMHTHEHLPGTLSPQKKEAIKLLLKD
jgi:hypothetical protein